MVELLASDYRLLAQDIVAFGLIVLALLYGGAPERAVAITWLVVFEAADWINDLFLGGAHKLAEVDYYLASMDFVAGALFILIALYANRNYILWIAGMQVLAMTAHVARAMVEAISPIAYITMVSAPGWLQLLFLAIGLSRHIHRKRKYGPYRDWRIVRRPPDFGRIDQTRSATFPLSASGKVSKDKTS